jgi:mannosyltransferase
MINRIRFIGEIPAADLPALMRALSLVVQMPRYEGYGMVPLEGMASAVPFVASDAGFYDAFSAQGRCGSVVPQEFTEAAAEAARAILTDPDRYAAMAAAARDLAVASFSARAEAHGIETVYQQLWAEG